jgi:hypothetical protein
MTMYCLPLSRNWLYFSIALVAAEQRDVDVCDKRKLSVVLARVMRVFETLLHVKSR